MVEAVPSDLLEHSGGLKTDPRQVLNSSPMEEKRHRSHSQSRPHRVRYGITLPSRIFQSGGDRNENYARFPVDTPSPFPKSRQLYLQYTHRPTCTQVIIQQNMIYWNLQSF